MQFHDGTPYVAEDRPGKRNTLKTLGIPILAGVVGLALGAGASATGAHTEISELRLAEQSLTTDVATLEAKHTSTVEDLRVATSALDERTESLSDREENVRALTAQVEELQAQVRDLEAAAAAAEAQAAAVPEPIPFAAPKQAAPEAQAPAAPAPQPAAAYFDNCTAARNAGAAPVYAGDPGYGRHLDRDGDGVGCE
ncbi:excalibur calcium-binding domain-containing protein [Leucobacter sp. G161]|uniref:excalibur calcium-binding domain-containing protein n=1 Tax=Leucobacter sp. G161 TaxID=663704 RepID=UPI000AE559DB|nr:excalibur calcium-binding domain-containing protein [Leucobacter sp. G161]